MRLPEAAHTHPFTHKPRGKWFDGLAAFGNEKTRKLHAEVTAGMAKEREEMRRAQEEDERAMERYLSEPADGAEEQSDPFGPPLDDEGCDDDIPF
jgi:hypothetical protein